MINHQVGLDSMLNMPRVGQARVLAVDLISSESNGNRKGAQKDSQTERSPPTRLQITMCVALRMDECQHFDQ